MTDDPFDPAENPPEIPAQNPYARPSTPAPAHPGPAAQAAPSPTPAVPAQEPAPGSVVVTGVTVKFGRVRAVDEVSLVAEPGTVVALTGPSGAGKTTLLWAIAGAVQLSSGEVQVAGGRITDRRSGVQADVALIPQGNGLAGVLTAYENVVFPLLAARVGASEAEERAGRRLAEVGLEDSANHLVEELSGGQQQRVAVARGLAATAAVLLADEPTSELDHTNRERVLDLLRAEAQRGAVVVMATHDPEAAATADREVRLDVGRLAVVR